jgi:hypothetical protein
MSLSKQSDLVDGMMLVQGTVNVRRAHQQWMDHGVARGGEPARKVPRRVLVHQEADGAAVHSVDRLPGAHVTVQGLQHQPVATERHHDIAFGRIGVAV